jgi:hypothetical protein
VTRTRLDDLYTDMGEWEAAADSLARAGGRLVEVGHYPFLAQNSHSYGRLFALMGDEATAQRYYAEALAWREECLGPDHPHTRQSRQALDALRAGRS